LYYTYSAEKDEALHQQPKPRILRGGGMDIDELYRIIVLLTSSSISSNFPENHKFTWLQAAGASLYVQLGAALV
jgi:hypothetical protein